MIVLIIMGLLIWLMVDDAGAFHTHDYGPECGRRKCFNHWTDHISYNPGVR